MFDNDLLHGCVSGTEFEDIVVKVLNAYGFKATKTGKNDKGIDIVAVSTTKPQKYTFNIQCKYYNRTVGYQPIQEVHTGTDYYKNGGRAVVITNNRVSADARIYAKQVGVEIIADAEWQEIQQVIQARKIINPNPRRGLMGILLAHITRDHQYLIEAVKEAPTPISDKEQLKLELISNFDAAEEYVKEAAYLQQRAAEFTQRAMTLQKEALLKNLEYG